MTVSDLTKGFAIYMLPAYEGDCTYVQIPLPESRFFRLLIDCGPVACWNISLKPFLELIRCAGGKIDLLILTHIDGDHIGGAIPLLDDDEAASLIQEVWFNGLHQVLPEDLYHSSSNSKENHVFSRVASENIYNFYPPSEQISAKQAISISEKLIERKIPWNSITGGKAISNDTLTYQIASDIFIDLLLPTSEGLGKLYSIFKKEVNSIKMGTQISESAESRLAFEQILLCNREKATSNVPICSIQNDVADLQSLANSLFKEDKSITNGSSIAICIRYHRHALLFPGDAHGDDLLSALKHWSVVHDLPLRFLAVKLPHHGSAHNCITLLDQIESSLFLISTDGHKFSHPNKETIAKILVKSSQLQLPIKIIFNYQCPIYRKFYEYYKNNPEIVKQICFTQDCIPLLCEE